VDKEIEVIGGQRDACQVRTRLKWPLKPNTKQ